MPIPDAYRLIVGGADNPRIVLVKEGGANIIEMPEQCEDALALLIVPDLSVSVRTSCKIILSLIMIIETCSPGSSV